MILHLLKPGLEGAGSWVWQTSLQAGVLILLVWLVRWLFGRALPVRWHHALGLLVLLRLVMPVAPTSSLSLLNVKHFFQAPASASPRVPDQDSPSVGAIPFGTAMAQLARAEPRSHMAAGIQFHLYAKEAWLLGFLGLMAIAAGRHRRLSRAVARGKGITDLRLRGVLEEARTALHCRRQLTPVAVAGLSTPAVFGVWCPRLLLPEGLVDRLSEAELRLILLHEVAHLRRGDALLNWAAILVRALHWFNPLVWLALRQMRADQELVCDGMVLCRVRPQQRRLYGRTLIKLLGEFAETGPCPGLVPILTHKHEMKRRITRIAQFKPAGRVAQGGGALLATALCAVTFTRAAEPAQQRRAPEPPKMQTADVRGTGPETAEVAARSWATNELAVFKEEREQQERRVAASERELNRLRNELQMPAAIADGDAPPPKMTPQVQLRLEAQCLDAQAVLIESQTLLKRLQALPRDQLRRSITTVYPEDAELAALMLKGDAVEQQLAELRLDYADHAPDVQKALAVLKTVNRQIEDRIDGVMTGLKALVASKRATIQALRQAITAGLQQDAATAARYSAYFVAKRRCQIEQELLDVLSLKITQQKVDMKVPALLQQMWRHRSWDAPAAPGPTGAVRPRSGHGSEGSIAGSVR